MNDQILSVFVQQYEQLCKTVSCFQNNKDEIQKEHDQLKEKLKELNQSFHLQENIIDEMTSKGITVGC